VDQAILGAGHQRDRRQAHGDPREVGPESVYWLGSAKFYNEAAYLYRKFAAFLGTNSVDHRHASCHFDHRRGRSNTWGYGAMTNSYNDIRNAKTMVIMGGNPAEAHPVSLQHLLEGKELNRANFIVIEPRLNADGCACDGICAHAAGTNIPVNLRDALAHFQERLGRQGVYRARVLRHGRDPQRGREVAA